MKPVIALVGRPNVGKSTLFNCLTRSRDALVADQPGLTRDRKYGEGKFEGTSFIVVDTGGLSDESYTINDLMAEQAWLAIEEADIVLFLTDARDGLVVGDEDISDQLRRTSKPITLVVNKIDGLNAEVVQADFYALGLGEPVAISASHHRGVSGLLKQVLYDIPQPDASSADQPAGIKVAIVGKPNVGKSTLVNRILGEQRVLAYDQPGTTRDSIYIPFKRQDQDYVLIDTAGVRRRGKVNDKLEKFSVIKSLQAIQHANVVMLVIDAHQGITDQDSHLLGFIIESGRALLIAVNKWDGLQEDERQRIKSELQRKLQFCEYAKIFFISALHGTGVGELYAPIGRAYRSAIVDAATSRLTRVLESAVDAHQPPLVRGRRIKLRYAHQGGKNPPVIVIHGNQTEKVPQNYRRYLMNCFIQALQLEGTPVRVDFKTGENPYKGKRNLLTKSQISKKQRLRQHTRKSGKK
ncbi:MAG: ribosome biogenesis GTPase Der [Gammaproteobacteria bacterium]|nr:ribosome biogenesis GTPase Der [Gammaproteobacteria bacterium]